MNDPGRIGDKPAIAENPEPASGPSLALIYSLIGIALVAAMVIAGFIVLPFYHRH